MPLSNRYLERYAGLLIRESLATGEMLFQEGKLDEAQAFFGKILQANPEHHEALNNMGTVLYTKGDLPAAETRFLKAFSFRSDDDNILLNLIDLYISQKRWRDAIPFLERHAAHECCDHNRLNQLALAYIEAGERPKAVPILLRSLRLNPGQPEIRDVLETMQRRPSASSAGG